MNYSDSVAYCKTLDAYLVKVNDYEENSHLAKLLEAGSKKSSHLYTVLNNLLLY